jgi:hypothetical protein
VFYFCSPRLGRVKGHYYTEEMPSPVPTGFIYTEYWLLYDIAMGRKRL